MYLREDFPAIESRDTSRLTGFACTTWPRARRTGRSWCWCTAWAAALKTGATWRRIWSRAGFRVYMPDLLGYGRSERPADFSYSVRDEAGVVVGFMDALGLKQVDLGGWSMGGWIAEIVAAEHPERVSRLMLFDAAGLDVKPTWNTNLFMPTSAGELDQLDALLMPRSAAGFPGLWRATFCATVA